ncbi:hypothetical protein R6Q59_018277 [Mikania micrantha]
MPPFFSKSKLERYTQSGDKFLWQPPLTRPTNSDATRQDEVLRTVSRKNNDGLLKNIMDYYFMLPEITGSQDYVDKNKQSKVPYINKLIQKQGKE